MEQSLLRRVALFARRKYRLVLLVAAVAMVCSLLLATRVHFDTDVLNLLPKDEPVVKTFRHALETFGSVEYLLVVVRIPEGAVVDPYEMFADRLGQRLEQLDLLEDVQYRLGGPEEILEAFFPKAALFLDGEGRETLLARLGPEAVEGRAQELRQLISTPQSLALKEFLKIDPLGLSEIFVERLTGARGGLAVDWKRGYLLSKDHRLLMLLARPTQSPQDIVFDRRLVASINDEVAAVQREWPDLVRFPDAEPPEVALGGTYVIALEDGNLIQKDVIVNVVTSMAGVLLLFLFAFRRLGLLFYAFLPLSCGLILNLGFASLRNPVLSLATSGCAALLIGLGIDFVIVSYGRFVEERQRGASLNEALSQMSGSSGRAVVVGAVTSAATFFSFGVTDFPGLLEMGLLTGTGILFCMLAVLFLLPAMLAWSSDRHVRRASEPRLYLHGLGSARLIRGCMRRPKWVLVLAGLLTLVCGRLALNLQFEDSVRNMRPAGNPGVLVQEEVAAHFGSGFDYMMLVSNGATASEAVSLSGGVERRARQFVDGENLLAIDAVTSMIPPPEQQNESLEWLRQHREGRLDPSRLRESIASAFSRAGLRSEPFAAGLELLESMVSTDQPMTLEDLRQAPQGDQLLRRYLQKTAGGWESVVYLHPPAKVWKRRPPPLIEALAEELGPQTQLTGTNVVNNYLRGRVRQDAVQAALLGLVLVAFLLWLDYRRLDATLLSLAPLLIGIVWMLGFMVALGKSMNFMNIFVTTMIIGIGVDYGVHMVHRFRECQNSDVPGALEDGLAETGKAIVLAALSTVVGFGSLSLSHYPGLQSMGILAVVGALVTSLAAVTVLPAYLALRTR